MCDLSSCSEEQNSDADEDKDDTEPELTDLKLVHAGSGKRIHRYTGQRAVDLHFMVSSTTITALKTSRGSIRNLLPSISSHSISQPVHRLTSQVLSKRSSFYSSRPMSCST